MDVRGKICTLYPLSWQGANLPPSRPIGFNLSPVVQQFHAVIAEKLTRSGLVLRMPVDGQPDQGLVIRPQVVVVDPGVPFGFTAWFGGVDPAAFDVEGLISIDGLSLGEFYAQAAGRATMLRSGADQALAMAAKVAAKRAAKQILAVLRGWTPGGFGAGAALVPNQIAPVLQATPMPVTAGAPRTGSPRQWQAYARLLLADGWRPSQVGPMLLSSGLGLPQAQGVMAAAGTELRRRVRKMFTWGTINLTLGILITVAAFAYVSNTGRTGYYFYWFVLLIPAGLVQLHTAYQLNGRLKRD